MAKNAFNTLRKELGDIIADYNAALFNDNARERFLERAKRMKGTYSEQNEADQMLGMAATEAHFKEHAEGLFLLIEEEGKPPLLFPHMDGYGFQEEFQNTFNFEYGLKQNRLIQPCVCRDVGQGEYKRVKMGIMGLEE